MTQVQKVTQEQYNELLKSERYVTQLNMAKAELTDKTGHVKNVHKEALISGENLKDLHPNGRIKFKAVTYKRGLYMLIATVRQDEFLTEDTPVKGLYKSTAFLYENGVIVDKLKPRYEYHSQLGLVSINLSQRNTWENNKRTEFYTVNASVVSKYASIEDMEQYTRETQQALETMRNIVTYLKAQGETVTED